MTRRIGARALAAAEVVAALVAAAWCAGLGLSDRFAWSQWLAWIPTPAVALALGAAAGAALAAGRRRNATVWGLLLAVVAARLAVVEHRPFAGAPRAAHEFRVVHWAIGVGQEPDEKARTVDAVTQQEPDLVVFTNAGHMASTPGTESWTRGGSPPLLSGPFRVFSRRPVRTLRPLVATDGITMVQLVLEEPSAPEGTLRILLVDLPSDPRVARMALARRARRLLDAAGAPPPDVVIGDLNITRGSASLRHLFPAHRHAWDDAGRGWSGSFPRHLPVHHIDHVLLSSRLRCVDYVLVDGSGGRHRFQVASLRFDR